jgi:hypothetical protein
MIISLCSLRQQHAARVSRSKLAPEGLDATMLQGFDGALGAAQLLRDFLDGQSGKQTHLNDLPLPRVAKCSDRSRAHSAHRYVRKMHHRQPGRAELELRRRMPIAQQALLVVVRRELRR